MSESKRNPIDITEIHCPDCCTVPAAEKGCHFQAGADAFTCAKCQLRIRRSYSGYLLTCEDLNEMLHGLKITSEAKALLRGGKEHKARLVFDETYRVCLAPKSRAVEREETREVCPNCGAKIYLITKGDGSKHYGCAGFPKCTYASKYVPHTFNRDAAVQQDSRPSQAEAEKAAPVQHEEQIAVPAPANPAAPAAKTNPEPRAPEAVAPKQDVEAGPLLDASGAPAARLQPRGDEIAATETLSLPPDITEPLIERTSDKYWRIPNFIKELLRLQDEDLAPTRLEMRAPRTPLPHPPEAEVPVTGICLPYPRELALMDVLPAPPPSSQPEDLEAPDERLPVPPSIPFP